MSNSPLTQEQVQQALNGLLTPEQIDILSVCDGHVKLEVILASTADPNRDALFAKIQEKLSALPGAVHVQVGVSLKTPLAKPAFSKPGITQPAPPEKVADPIQHIIAISSGKGGVGKTTVTVNLACALQQQGFSVGILDADVYGPNVPIMMGLRGQKLGQDPVLNKLEAPENHGVKVVSMAFLVKEEQPIIWRGPMLDRVIRQFYTDTKWGGLDYLLIDLPPGTGDAQLTVMQALPLTGAIIVTTPQEVALHDSKKGLAMFQDNKIPVLGLIENMSYFVCEHGSRYEIFGNGGGRKAAEQLGVAFLAEIPLVAEQRSKADDGLPVVVYDTNGEQAGRFKTMAQTVVKAIDQLPQREPVTAGH